MIVMEDGDAAKQVQLSPYERFALAQIEAELRYDRRFTRHMSGRQPRIWLRLAVGLMIAASVFLAVMGMRTSDPAVLWCFAGVWPLTLVLGLRLLRRVTRRNGQRA